LHSLDGADADLFQGLVIKRSGISLGHDPFYQMSTYLCTH